MKITEKSSISISLVITLLGGVGFVTWIASETRANTSQLAKVDTKIEALQSMQTDLAIIRTKVENIESEMTRKSRR